MFNYNRLEVKMDRTSIYSNRALNQSAKLLLLYLTEFKPENPKVCDLAKQISVTTPTLIASLNQLNDLGYIQKGIHVIENTSC